MIKILFILMVAMVYATSLRETIDRGEFYTISEVDLLKQIHACFETELDRLKNADAVERGSPKLEVYHQSNKQTPSEILYDGLNFDEINRTLTGVLALRWIMNDEYDVFVSGQPLRAKLKRDSFGYLQKFFRDHLETPEDLFALVLSMVVNDLGKDPKLEKDFYQKYPESNNRLHGQNHDTILYEAAKAGMVPSLYKLSESYRQDVMLGVELGSQLNAGQLAQAENVPINLEGLLEMRGHEHAFHLKYMEQVLDVAGASAHYDPRGARNFVEHVFQGFRTVYEVSLDIIARNCSLRQGYDRVLTRRSKLLNDTGFRRLTVSNDKDRALLRLLTMGRTTTKEQADLFESAFEALPPQNRATLIAGLNVDGNDNETAVLPYYMPAMLSRTLAATEKLSLPEQCAALAALMRYLARVLDSTGTEGAEKMPDDLRFQVEEQQTGFEDGKVPGIVIERNMMEAKDVISGEDFKKNPGVLDNHPIPKGQVLQRRRTSHSVVEMSLMTENAVHNVSRHPAD